MSNRRRITTTRTRPYAARPAPPRQRRPDRGTPRAGPAPAWPGWLGGPWPVLVPALAAEVGHLAAAYLEWPGSPARGGYHVLAGALLGLVAALVRTGSGAPALLAGAAVGLAGPVLWLAGGPAGASPYAELAVPAAAAVAACEVALAAVLVAGWRAGRSPADPG